MRSSPPATFSTSDSRSRWFAAAFAAIAARVAAPIPVDLTNGHPRNAVVGSTRRDRKTKETAPFGGELEEESVDTVPRVLIGGDAEVVVELFRKLIEAELLGRSQLVRRLGQLAGIAEGDNLPRLPRRATEPIADRLIGLAVQVPLESLRRLAAVLRYSVRGNGDAPARLLTHLVVPYSVVYRCDRCTQRVDGGIGFDLPERPRGDQRRGEGIAVEHLQHPDRGVEHGVLSAD
jgi:hypothetical protein